MTNIFLRKIMNCLWTVHFGGKSIVKTKTDTEEEILSDICKL